MCDLTMCPDCGRKVEPEDIYIMSYGYCWHCVEGDPNADEDPEECAVCGEELDGFELCPFGCDDEEDDDD